MTALIPYDTGTLELAVQMGIGLQTSVWDTDTWDFSQWSEETVGGWVDVTCDVSEVTITSGASAPDGVLTAINATTGGVVLHGDQYNPWGPEYGQGQLGPKVPVRLLWRRPGDPALVPVFTGVTDSWPYERSTETASVALVDATGGLANNDLLTLPGPAGQGEGISARMNRILDAASWSTAARQIPADTRPTISTTLGEAAWTMLQNAADTGLGLVWIDRSGNVAYLPIGQVGGWQPHHLGISLSDVHLASTNLLSDEASSFEGGTIAGWWPGGQGVQLSVTQAVAAAGSHAMAITCTVAADASITNPPPYAPVTPGLRYTFRAKVMAATIPHQVQMWVEWLDPSNNVVGGVVYAPTVLDSTTQWTEILLAGAQAPYGSTKALITVYFRAAVAGEVHYVDDIWFTLATADPYAGEAVCVVDYANTDPTVVRNVVTIARAADPAIDGDTPVAATDTDAASVARYGPVTYSRDDLIHQQDSWSAVVAQAVLANAAQPAMHPQQAMLDIKTDPQVADLLLAAEIGDVLYVHDTGQLFQCVVVGYSVDITRSSLTGSLVLSDVSMWTGGLWDSDQWDQGLWGL